MTRTTLTLAIMAAALLAAVPLPAQDTSSTAASPLVVTTVPPAGQGGPDRTDIIAGKVNFACEGCRIVLFAKGGDTWFVQPLTDDPYTTISEEKWSNETHLGAAYAALLVKPGYVPPSRTATLPGEGDLVIAVVVVPGRK